MKALLKKEFRLCLHPTALIFLAFAGFVFIPSYPYEVMFFFSGLSVFFICLTARENGDAAFTCVLPVKKGDVARARIFMCVILQVALLALAACATAVKQLYFPLHMQINQAGIMANTAFLGGGALLLGCFDLIFFPLYWGAPEKVGIPFLIASISEFVIITVFLVCRHAVPCRCGQGLLQELSARPVQFVLPAQIERVVSQQDPLHTDPAHCLSESKRF